MDDNLNRLDKAQISYYNLFLNADTGFDCKSLESKVFDSYIILNVDENKRRKLDFNPDYYNFDAKLYAHQYMIERTNV